MKRIIFAVALTAGMSAAYPSALVYPSHPFALTREEAMIVWDPATKVEHLVREATFDTDAPDMGFIVPVPAFPKVAKVDPRVFTATHIPAAPWVEPLERKLPENYCGPDPRLPRYGCLRYTELRVGDYQAAILKATDGKAVAGWLLHNGYSSRPALSEWLDSYAKKDWYFVALKLIRDPGVTTDRTCTVRITFKSATPFFPFKQPTDMWSATQEPELSLSFISSAPAQAGFGLKPDLDDSHDQWTWDQDLGICRASVANCLGIPEEQIPSGAILSGFSYGRGDRRDRDLRFWLKPNE